MHCANENCENEPTTRYMWPWGDEGVVCDGHRVHMSQLAQQLGRDVAFTALQEPRAAAAAAAVDSPELQLAKAKLLEMEQTIHDNAQLISNLRGELARRARSGLRPEQIDSDVEEAEPSSTTTPAPAAATHKKR